MQGDQTTAKSSLWNPEIASWTNIQEIEYNASMNILILYLGIINLVAWGLMGADKRRAQKHMWRIPERTMFTVALLGGSLGAILGMYLWHHKTKHWYFVIGMPLIFAAQIAAVIWIGGKF